MVVFPKILLIECLTVFCSSKHFTSTISVLSLCLHFICLVSQGWGEEIGILSSTFLKEGRYKECFSVSFLHRFCWEKSKTKLFIY